MKRREGKPQRVCQSHKGNDNSPFERLGKATLATVVRWGNPTSETPPATGAFLCANIRAHDQLSFVGEGALSPLKVVGLPGLTPPAH